VRFAVAVVLLLAWARISGRAVLPAEAVLPRHRMVWGVQAVFNFLIPYSLTYWAEQWVPSGLVAVLFSTMPIFVMLIAYFVLPEERLGPAGVLGMGLGFTGIAVIYSADLTAIAGPEAAFAAVVFLLSPLSAACGQVVVKRWGGDLSALSLTVVPMALAVLMLGVLAAIFERGRAMEPTAMAIGAVLYLALLGTALAFTLYFWLLKHVSATQLSLITYATPVVAVALGTLWLDEPLTLRLVVGGLLVIGGMGLAARRKRTAS
jgi:drug/metabolite transporter (DMT)-like permease